VSDVNAHISTDLDAGVDTRHQHEPGSAKLPRKPFAIEELPARVAAVARWGVS